LKEGADESCASCAFWGAQAASMQVSAACRDRGFRCGFQNSWREDALDRVAGNYRLAACVLRD